MNIDKLKRLFKRVLFFLIITILLWLCKLSFVNAATFNFNNLTLKDDTTGAGGSWNPNTPGYYFNTNGNRTINFETDIVGDLFDSLNYQYGFISYCSYDDIYQTYNQNSTYSEQLQMFDTYVKSTIYGSSIHCTIKYITWKFKYDCGAGGTNCYARPRFQFWGSVSDYALRSYGFTKEPLQVDTTTGQVINQNATIISQNQTIINKTDETNKKLDDLNKNLTDETPPDFNGLKNSAGWLPKGPVDSIINLPLSLLENIQDNLGKTCQPVSLPLPFVNKNIDLPCINSLYSQIEGMNTFFNWVGVVASVFILFRYLIYLYNRVDSTLTLRENTLPGYFEDSMWGGM